MNANNRGRPDTDYYIPYMWIIDFKNGDVNTRIDGQVLKPKTFLLRSLKIQLNIEKKAYPIL